MIEKLFESLDEKVFTDELKANLSTMFNENVETMAEAKAEAKAEEKVEAVKVALAEELETTKAELVTEAEAKEKALLEGVDAYLEKVVDEFIHEAKGQLTDALNAEKADLVIEAFDAMLVAGAVDVARIVEAKDDGSISSKLDESIAKYDTLVEENISLEKENEKLIKMGVISEMSQDLSLVEAEKFEKLANLVDFEKSEEYAEKLAVIKESVKGSKVETTKVNENLNETVKTTYSHLI